MDLIEQLRNPSVPPTPYKSLGDLCREAATELAAALAREETSRNERDAALDIIGRLRAALELAADYIKDLDGGDQRSETGWKSDELLDVWLKTRAALGEPVICPDCKGERRIRGALCSRCKGTAQIARSELRPGERAPYEQKAEQSK